MDEKENLYKSASGCLKLVKYFVLGYLILSILFGILLFLLYFLS